MLKCRYKTNIKQKKGVILLSSITKNARYLPHDLATKSYVVKYFLKGTPINFLIRKYKVSRASIYRWVKQFNGHMNSPEPKSHRPLKTTSLPILKLN